MKVALAIQQAELILTVSDYSARSIHEFLGVPRAAIRVAAEAPAEIYRPSNEADIQRTARELGLPDGARWFVYVGGFNPHKRVTSLIWAHARVVREEREAAPYLLLVGDPGSDSFFQNTQRLRGTIVEAGTVEKVVWTGFVPDEQLRHVHSGALALVLPSEAEGFGLPAVEAAACGTPVIATNQSPLPELLAGGGIFLAPGDQETLEGALRLLSKDDSLRERMGRRALEGARALSWETGARAALSAIREAAA
jgi:alpha-1,3-rhamnosyl/mannosyltransferase